MTRREFLYWLAFAKLNGPLRPGFRNDWHAAQVAQALNGGRVRDHLLSFYRPPVDANDDAATAKRTMINFLRAEGAPLPKGFDDDDDRIGD